jgi:hypothetical protein
MAFKITKGVQLKNRAKNEWRGWRLRRRVTLAANAESIRAVQQVSSLTHEVGIASHVGLRVQPRHHLLEEVGRLRRVPATEGAAKRELGHPDFADAVLVGQVDGLADKVLEVLRRLAVPVHRQPADVAFPARIHERLQPVEALSRSVAIGHSGADERSLAGIRRDVVQVGRDSIRRGHVGLVRHVGLVEAQDVLASAGKHRLDGRAPPAEHLASPEHGNVLEAGGQDPVGQHVPIIRPGNRLGHGMDKRGYRVGRAALVGQALVVVVVVAMGGCKGRCGQESSSR